jgi:hypothetical protein
MRRLVAVLSGSVLAVAVSSGAALADAPQGSVTGGGQQFGPPPSFFTLAVHGDANGGNAKGSFGFANGPAGSHPWHVTVTCLLVSGNDAIATGVVDQPREAAGQLVVAEAVDNGEPRNGQAVDLLRFSFASNGGVFPGPTPNCFVPVFSPVPIQHGNIVVRQAVP